ncbi:MAG TPA: protein kinase [Polyangia bacterium]
MGGTYRIVRRIGSGGMGEVYEAAHERLAHRYAVKFLHPGVRDHPEALPRFMREAQITSRLRHPGIVSVVDFNTLPSGLAYLVMEYLEGESLGKLLRRTGPLPLPRVVDITDQLSSALTAAHLQGVVHRDMHPQNVFVVPGTGGQSDRIKVLDFGISKIASLSQKITGMAAVMGTPQYMSPEQAEGKADELDPSSDQFSLAAIVYEMLAGRPAFSGETLASIAYQIVHAQPPGVRTHRPELPTEMENVVSRGLSKNKKDRFPSVSEFAVHLRWTATLPPVEVPALSAQSAPTAVGFDVEETTAVSRLPTEMAAVLRKSSSGLPAVAGAPAGAVDDEATVVSEPAETNEPTPINLEPTPINEEPAPLNLEPTPINKEPAPINLGLKKKKPAAINLEPTPINKEPPVDEATTVDPPRPPLLKRKLPDLARPPAVRPPTVVRPPAVLSPPALTFGEETVVSSPAARRSPPVGVVRPPMTKNEPTVVGMGPAANLPLSAVPPPVPNRKSAHEPTVMEEIPRRRLPVIGTVVAGGVLAVALIVGVASRGRRSPPDQPPVAQQARSASPNAAPPAAAAPAPVPADPPLPGHPESPPARHAATEPPAAGPTEAARAPAAEAEAAPEPAPEATEKRHSARERSHGAGAGKVPAAFSPSGTSAGAQGGECRITVGTYPWSEVWLDGRDTGQQTPVVGMPIGCGPHRLQFKRRDLGIDQVENVTVTEGREFKRQYELQGSGIDD